MTWCYCTYRSQGLSPECGGIAQRWFIVTDAMGDFVVARCDVHSRKVPVMNPYVEASREEIQVMEVMES